MAMPGPFGNSNAGMSDQEQQTIKMMQAVMESCPAKVAMAGTAGNVIVSLSSNHLALSVLTSSLV
jgi:import inner membrane translocase subunit TIM22